MIRNYADDADVLEYLEGTTFSLARTFDSENLGINWDDISSACDQRYFSIRQGQLIPLGEDALNLYYKTAVTPLIKALLKKSSIH